MSRDTDPAKPGKPANEDEKNRSYESIGFGLFLIGLATAMNFLLDGMGPDDVAQMPWFIAMAFESGGKLGVTLVLCSIGVLCIVWGVVNTPGDQQTKSKAKALTTSAVPVRAVPSKASPADEAEVIAEEIPDEPVAPAKIPTKGGNGGRPSGAHDGAMVLSSAKYLKTGGPGTFRRGREHHTNTE